MSEPLFESQRVACLACGGPVHHPSIGRPRRYCDADCALEGKRASDRAHMTPQRLAAMRQAKARWTARRGASRIACGGQKGTACAKVTPEATE